MKTIAPEAPTSHTSVRSTARTPGAAVIDGREPSAVAVYAIIHSQPYATQLARNASARRRSVSVLVLCHQRQWRLEKNEQIEQHRPVLDVVKVELDALLDLLF